MPKNVLKIVRIGVTLAVVAVAVLVGRATYKEHFTNPWTRDGQVRAQVIQIAPRVSAPLIQLAVSDNQSVKAGDPLFKLDPRTFEAELAQAEAQLTLAQSNYTALDEQVNAAEAGVTAAEASVAQAESSINEAESSLGKNKAEFERKKSLLPQNATSERSVESAKASYEVSAERVKIAQASLAQAQASLLQAKANLAAAKANRGAAGDENANIVSARAAIRQAELNLEFTEAVAPVDGYVTNLQLRIGSQAVANQPVIALVDRASYWVHGYFKETQIAKVKAGDRAVITLMAYPDQPIEGSVESIGWGISQKDGSAGPDLLPSVNPSFDWIRLAQRIPVRVELGDIPEGVDLRVGTTASVVIHTAKK